MEDCQEGSCLAQEVRYFFTFLCPTVSTTNDSFWVWEQKIFLDILCERCIMRESKTVELVPAVRAISIYRDCRKTLPVARPGATPTG